MKDSGASSLALTEATPAWNCDDAPVAIAGTLLLPIGEALAKFVCEEDFSYVKACEGPACTLMFADHTRGHGALVQHGDLRQPRETGRPSASA